MVNQAARHPGMSVEDSFAASPPSVFRAIVTVLTYTLPGFGLVTRKVDFAGCLGTGR